MWLFCLIKAHHAEAFLYIFYKTARLSPSGHGVTDFIGAKIQ